ncbi:uncharacterized protein LOC107270192 isoform X3 [Cephus cinctus]|uniref:Uncharacterized protein LOC107270192 isoform X3 n=1 Tax=Cephus cinctus TaxID=211228 RepID=A0AAJ7RLV2_CEPCN|nr:uncharacterized protein LOC107270192 isoform X3 [Cephus cinctus]
MLPAHVPHWRYSHKERKEGGTEYVVAMSPIGDTAIRKGRNFCRLERRSIDMIRSKALLLNQKFVVLQFSIRDLRYFSGINGVSSYPFINNRKIQQYPAFSVADVSNLLSSLSEDAFKEKFGKAKPAKDTKIILSCHAGRRSAKVQEEIQKLGYESAYNYVGGWMDWESKQKV